MRELIVGTIFFGAMILLGVYTIILGEIPILKKTQTVQVSFPNAGGLDEGNDVRVNGVDVGKVAALHIEAETGKVTAVLQIQEGVKFYDDYIITVRNFSPLGGKYVDIRPERTESGELREDRKLLSQKDRMQLKGSTTPDLIDNLAILVENTRKDIELAVGNIRGVTEELRGTNGLLGRLINDRGLALKFDEILDSLQSASMTIDEILLDAQDGKGTIGKLLNDPKLYDDLAEIAARIKEGDGTLARLLNDEKLGTDLEETIQNLKSASNELNEILTRANEGKGTLGRLINDPTLYEELTGTAREFRKVAQSVNEGKGTVAALLHDEKMADDLKASVANVRSLTQSIRDGKGTLGKLWNDPALFDEARRVLVELRESVEDTREQAPINAFIGAVFSAF